MSKSKKQRRTVQQFNDHGYCLVRAPDRIIDMLPDIRQYLQFKELGNFNPDSEQVPNAHYEYADPLFETLLLKFLPNMQQWTGLRLLPTYSYARIYRNGQELTIHQDRPPCEISATFCIAYSYHHYQWPIYMGGSMINMEPGDVAVYRGCKIPHWREPLRPPVPENVYHMQSFFHYVNADGPYADQIFDSRPGLGLPKTTKQSRMQQPPTQQLPNQSESPMHGIYQ